MNQNETSLFPDMDISTSFDFQVSSRRLLLRPCPAPPRALPKAAFETLLTPALYRTLCCLPRFVWPALMRNCSVSTLTTTTCLLVRAPLLASHVAQRLAMLA